MSNNEFRLAEPNVAYIGAGVIIKGEITAPDVIMVDGTIEGDVTARSIRVGVTGAIKGKVVSSDADIHGSLSERVEVKDFLLVRSTGRIEGNVSCGDVQVEKGAVLAGGVFSVQQHGAEKPAWTESPANADQPMTLAAAE